MRQLIRNVLWDAKLIVRYNIFTVAAIITSIYCLLFAFVSMAGLEKLIVTIIFSDPVMYGYLFVTVMILFEKEAGTLQAFAITPRKTIAYIWSRNIAFTLLALLCSSLMLIFAQTPYVNYGLFLLAVVLSSSLFVFIGVASITRVKNFNQFIVVIPIVLLPTSLPFLGFWGFLETDVWYIIPTQACLILFQASIADVHFWKVIYAITYLLIWNFLAYRIALKWYFKYILNSNRNE